MLIELEREAAAGRSSGGSALIRAMLVGLAVAALAAAVYRLFRLATSPGGFHGTSTEVSPISQKEMEQPGHPDIIE